MTRSWPALTVRLHRDIVLLAILTIGGLTVAANWATTRLTDLRAGGCLPISSCAPAVDAHQLVSVILAVIAGVPTMGVVLGAPLVARELERSTTTLAWALDAGRRRWFWQRTLPIFVVALTVGMAAAFIGDRLEGALDPSSDPSASFAHYGFRGPILTGRVLLAFGCGLLAGCLTGRSLTAMLLAFTVGGSGLFAIDQIHQRVLEGEAIPVAQATLGDGYAGLQFRFRFQLAPGRLVTYEELAAIYPEPEAFDAALLTATPTVDVIEPLRYQEIAAREGLVDILAGLTLIALAGWTAGLRGPDAGPVRWTRAGLSRAPAVGFDRAARAFPDAVRLTLTAHRRELGIAVAMALASAASIGLLLAGLAVQAVPTSCLADPAAILTGPGCTNAEAYLLLASDWGARLFAALMFVPWLVGAIVGVVLIAREIEEGTVLIAWALQPDRRVWLASRALVGVALVVALLVPIAVLAEFLQRAAHPWILADRSFETYGLRSIPLVARGIAAIAIGMLCAAVTRRVLSSLLLAIAISGGTFFVLAAMLPFGVPVDIAASQGAAAEPLPAGTLLLVQLREAAVLGGLIAAELGLALALLDRRAV